MGLKTALSVFEGFSYQELQLIPIRPATVNHDNMSGPVSYN